MDPDWPYLFAYFGSRNTFLMHFYQKTRKKKASWGTRKIVGEPSLALLIRVFWDTKHVLDAFLPERTNK